MRTLPTFLLVVALLTACGQAGDLYLPKKTPPPAVDQPTPEEKKKTVPPLQTEPAPPVQQ